MYDSFKEKWNAPGVLRALPLEDVIMIETNQHPLRA
jgi:hypothetical protein